MWDRRALGMLPFHAEVKGQAQPNEADHHHAEIRRGLPHHGAQQDGPIVVVDLQHATRAPVCPALSGRG